MSPQLIDSGKIEYIQQFDAVPEFWQYLVGLRSDDLVAELIQNELDANASHTSIKFYDDRMICQGDGDPVDEDGWKRLTFITGAGDLAPRKRQRFGIKNHGLKVCFTIGNDINVRSNRKMIKQTLYKNGIDQPPSPATYPYPLPDEAAPDTGCSVEVPYRRKVLTVNLGEPFELDPPSAESIEGLFLRTCREIPQRFIGALRPHVRPRYIIELSHYRLGTARFEFSCGRERAFRRLKLYNRTCRISGDVSNLPDEMNESCCLFSVRLPESSNREIPDFYSARKGFFLSEVAWKTQGQSRPVVTLGRRRYPITYGGSDKSALTGMGFHFSGPYISDLERRGAIDADALNDYIDNACKSVIVAILRYILIPQHGARVMNLLMANPENPDEDTLRKLVERILEARALPLARRITGTPQGIKRTRSKKRGGSMRFGPIRTVEGKIRRVVLTTFSWEKDKVSPLLAELCPAGEDQIDSSVPAPILKLLAGASCEGWKENHITFDEQDVIARLQPTRNITFFPWPNEKAWRKALSDPYTACHCIDVVMGVYENGPGFKDDDLRNLLANAFLPDSKPTATPLPTLYAGVSLPTGLLVRDTPPILHPRVAGHPIFKRNGWKRRCFTFGEFIDRAEIENADEKTRRSFWRWVKANWKSVPKEQWVRIAGLPIWPDRSGNLLTLSALCKPSNRKVAAILKDDLNRPDPDVYKIDKVKKAKKGNLHIRTKPTENEVTSFVKRRLAEFPQDRVLSCDEQQRFLAYEMNLAELASDYQLRAYLKYLPEIAIALNGNGHLRPVGELVRVEQEIKALHLLEEDVINRKAHVLDRIEGLKPRVFPSSDQILRALKQDAGRRDAFLPRLQAYVQAAKREHKDQVEVDIVDVACIPDDGRLYAPGSLAFTGGRADYWGSWKHRISGKGLSADVQKVYQAVGVLGPDPTPEASLAFFEWLKRQEPRIVAANLACIIRHINHRKGPKSWGDENPGCPFIPVEADNGSVQLVSQTAATASHSRVLIPDFKALESAIRQTHGNRRAQLAIVSHPAVKEPITPLLRDLGVKSLHIYAGNPIAVEGKEARPAPKKLLDELAKMRTPRMSRELRKRLDNFGLDINTFKIKGQWRDRLSQIRNINVATSVMAKFKVGRHQYTVPMEAVFDEETGTIWLADLGVPLGDLFYQTIAERLFENPSEFLAIVLREALRREFREDVVYGKGLDDTGEEDEEGEWDDDGDDDDDGEPGATDKTHKGVSPNLGKNVPKPGPIPTGVGGRVKPLPPSGGKHMGRGKGDGRGRERPKIEEIQIEDLKQNQYAWHCQICLAKRTTEQLAPVNSYVEIQENRSMVIRTHHPDQVHAGGARHAGNMLVLCNHHHQYLGDAISRQDVTKAIKETATDYQVVFQTSSHDKIIQRTVSGKLVTIILPLTGDMVKCFFTDSHAEYWLRKAS